MFGVQSVRSQPDSFIGSEPILSESEDESQEEQYLNIPSTSVIQVQGLSQLLSLIKNNHGCLQLGNKKYQFDIPKVDNKSIGVQANEYKLTFDVQAQTDPILSLPIAQLQTQDSIKIA